MLIQPVFESVNIRLVLDSSKKDFQIAIILLNRFIEFFYGSSPGACESLHWWL